MLLDHRFNLLSEVRATVAVVVYPIQYAVNFPVSAGEWMDESFSSRESLLAEITTLKTQQTVLNARLQKMAALETENIRLRQLLDSTYKIGGKVLIAELTSVNLEPFSREIVINKGSSSGVYEGQPLLDANGIMGQITTVTPFTSTAMLITDPNHAIPVAVNRNGLRAIAIGSKDALALPHFPNNADIKVGDLLVSSGLGGRFPTGYPVGTISQVEIDSGQPFARVSASPTALLQQTREVLLIWPEAKLERLTEDATQQHEEAK